MLEFSNPVFKPGRNTTVRRGEKWYAKQHARVAVGETILTVRLHTMTHKFSRLDDHWLRDEHDPSCRTVSGLLAEMQRVYPGFSPSETVTLVDFYLPDYTTPQPSAAEDAAVGAQGDGEPDAGSREEADLHYASLAEAALNKLRVIGPITPPEDIAIQATINRLRWYASNAMMPAAPAAGKGVDDAMVERALDAQSEYWGDEAKHVRCETCKGTGEDRAAGDWCGECGGQGLSFDGDESGAMRAALEAALTRQPVAGDGNDAANWRRAKACMSAIGQSDKSVSYACALLLSENTRKVNAGRAEITLRGITDGDEECGDWRITVEQLAAPTATPTDGREGKS